MAGFLMLASPADEENLKFPLLASPKIDGIRGAVVKGILTSRSGKPIRNEFVQQIISRPELESFDGELVVGDASAPDVIQKSAAVNAFKGEPDFHFYVFDLVNFSGYAGPDYQDRLAMLVHAANPNHLPPEASKRVTVLTQKVIENSEDLAAYEAYTLSLGFEGVMIRDPYTKYKNGRSTAKGRELNKLKRFEDEEAVIVGYEVLMHNANEAFIDELGRTKRSDAKDGLVPTDMIGAYIVKSPKYEKTFNVSCGSMTIEERKRRLASISEDIGKTITYKFFRHGMKDVPRHAIYKAFRHEDDMS